LDDEREVNKKNYQNTLPLCFGNDRALENPISTGGLENFSNLISEFGSV